MCAVCHQRSQQQQQQLHLVCYCRYRAVHLSTSTTFDLSTCLYIYNRYIYVYNQRELAVVYILRRICDRHSCFFPQLFVKRGNQSGRMYSCTDKVWLSNYMLRVCKETHAASVPIEYTFPIHFCDEPFFIICISSFGFLGFSFGLLRLFSNILFWKKLYNRRESRWRTKEGNNRPKCHHLTFENRHVLHAREKPMWQINQRSPCIITKIEIASSQKDPLIDRNHYIICTRTVNKWKRY